jgi:DHA1 family multidrug resistance protein-like MFS transporter
MLRWGHPETMEKRDRCNFGRRYPKSHLSLFSQAPGGPDAAIPAGFLMLCGVGLFAIFSSTMSKSPVLPLFAEHLGASESQLGFIAAASTYTGILLSIPAGVLSDVWGRKRVLLLSGLVFASAPFLYLLVQTPAHLAVIRVYHGAATAIFGPVAMAYVADLAPVRRGERMGLYSSATLVGRSIAPFVGGFLLVGARGYANVYLVCGAAGALALLIGTRLPGASTAEEKSQVSPWVTAREALVFALRNRTVLVTSVIEAVQYFAFGAFETFLPIYAVRNEVPAWQIGIILAAQVATIALTKPIMGRLSDQVGRRPVIVGGLVLGALAVALLAMSPHVVTLAIAATLFGLSMSVVTASTSALVADASKAAHFGSSLGILSTIMDIGHSSGPVAAGFLVAGLAFPWMWGIVAGLLLVAAGGFAALMGPGAKRQP